VEAWLQNQRVKYQARQKGRGAHAAKRIESPDKAQRQRRPNL